MLLTRTSLRYVTASRNGRHSTKMYIWGGTSYGISSSCSSWPSTPPPLALVICVSRDGSIGEQQEGTYEGVVGTVQYM
ncbi:uncharacterized protein SEPMUDRAFT_150134 [Sphaerulina musiva SO2202]|uniref:Uncharacterized protein n=1 Tax=Sphaerulina musiva (strain SO2202) TaxID=692275 RepID=M3D1W3_SPHMS|nr:uncharacterized protein SEPMUDRAFT_150134 [Sphaerulina musiva SO2202]EMF11112.1 hypothetical protein SEPMUDRAFT_150134 [Sphaerulina musiva SO2202]